MPHVTLPDDVDLHARPAADFVRTAMGFSAAVQVAAGEREVDAKSLLSVLALGAKGGTELRLTAAGDDAAAALDALRESRGHAERLIAPHAPDSSGPQRRPAAPASRARPTRRPRLECPPRELLGLAVVERRIQARTAPRAGAHAQLVGSQAHEQRHRERVRCRLAADLERDPGCPRRARRGRDVLEYPRVVGRRLAVAKRSVPSVACVRSFVPMLRKSHSAAISAAAWRPPAARSSLRGMQLRRSTVARIARMLTSSA